MAVAPLGGVVGSANNTNATVTLPSSLVVGSVFLLQISLNNTDVITAVPSGLTLIDNNTSTSASYPNRLYSGVVDGTTIAVSQVLSFTLSATRQWAIVVEGYSGGNTTTVVQSYTTSGVVGATCATPAITPSSDAYVVGVVSSKSNGTAITSFTAPGGFTNRQTATAAGTFGGASVISDVGTTTASTTVSAGTFTPSSTPGVTISYAVALNIAAGGGGGSSGTASFVKQATLKATTNSGTVTFGSATTSGNLVVLVVAGDKDIGALTATGWTIEHSLTTTSVSLYYAWRVSAGETSYSVSWATDTAGGSWLWAGEYDCSTIPVGTWTRVGTAETAVSETAATSRSTGTTGAVTYAGLAISAHANDTANGTAGSWSNSFTSRFVDVVGTSNGPGIWVAEKQISAGATAETTLSAVNSDQISGCICVFAKVSTATYAPPPPAGPRRRLAMLVR